MSGSDSRAALAEKFNEQNGCTLYEQALKVSEEVGEVSEAVLGLNGDLLFKEQTSSEELGDELADLVSTCYYVADLAGVDDLECRVEDRLQGNLSRDDRSQDTEGEDDAE